MAQREILQLVALPTILPKLMNCFRHGVVEGMNVEDSGIPFGCPLQSRRARLHRVREQLDKHVNSGTFLLTDHPMDFNM